MEQESRMTNAEAIRQMTDEELFEFETRLKDGDIDYAVTFCDLCMNDGNELNLDCDGCLNHWLKQDAYTHYQGLHCPCGVNEV